MEDGQYTAMITDLFPEVEIGSVRRIEQGWDNVVLEIDAELLFRFPRRPELEPQLIKEMRLLPRLADLLPLAVPHPLYVCQGGERCTIPFYGYRKIGGVPLAKEHFASDGTQRLVRQLAGFLSALHRVPRQLAGEVGLPLNSAREWREHYRRFYERVRRVVFPRLDAPVRARCSARWDEFLQRDENFHFSPVLVHRDLVAEHILCRPESWTVTGVIDWGDATMGDPAIDFTGLLLDCGSAVAKQVLDHYQGEIDQTLWGRTSFYAYLLPFYEVLYGLDMEDPRYVSQGLDRLRQDVTDLKG
jgi:aminoglycoside 2''-phosphotransferase